MVELKQITYAQLKKLRREQWLKQNKICPILGKEIEYKDAVFDHKHKRKADKLGEDGKGLLRGVLHFQANSWEGKVTNSFQRYGLHKLSISLSDALRRLANYLDNPPMAPEYVHPNERVFEKIGKREFNLLCKRYFEFYPKRTKLPSYPRGGKITKNIKELRKKIK